MSILDHVWGESPAADRVWAQVCGLRPRAADRRRFMVLQAYMDDSWSKETGIFVLGGYIASAEQWAAFSREWEEMLPLACVDKRGKHRFKMSEMAAQGRDIRPFYNVIMRHVQASVACVVDMRPVWKTLDSIHAWILNSQGEATPFYLEKYKSLWRDPNFFALKALMDHFHAPAVREQYLTGIEGGVIDFYFDEWGKKNIIRDSWDNYVRNSQPEFQAQFGSEPRFESDDEFLPLQAADFRAWWVRKWVQEHGLDSREWAYPFPDVESLVPNLIIHSKEEELGRFLMSSISSVVKEVVTNHEIIPVDLETGKPLPYRPPGGS